MMVSSDAPIEALLLKRMKLELEAQVEKSYQPTKTLIQFQQQEMQELEAKLEASRKSFRSMIKVKFGFSFSTGLVGRVQIAA